MTDGSTNKTDLRNLMFKLLEVLAEVHIYTFSAVAEVKFSEGHF